MNIYAESSAVLAWLLEEPSGATVETVLASADHIFTSDLTRVECERAIHRERALERLSSRAANRLALDLLVAIERWSMVPLAPEILARACRPFPNEPIRSLDALHVASAIYVKRTHPDLALLSLDDRIRRVGASLGFVICPADR